MHFNVITHLQIYSIMKFLFGSRGQGVRHRTGRVYGLVDVSKSLDLDPQSLIGSPKSLLTWVLMSRIDKDGEIIMDVLIKNIWMGFNSTLCLNNLSR